MKSKSLGCGGWMLISFFILLVFVIGGFINSAFSVQRSTSSQPPIRGEPRPLSPTFTPVPSPTHTPGATSTPGPTSTSTPLPPPTRTFEQISEGVPTITYEELARYTEQYIDKQFLFTGEIIQVVEDGQRYVMRILITKTEYGWDDPILVKYKGDFRPLEDDIINFVARVEGRITYESTSGQQITIPGVYFNSAREMQLVSQ